MRDSAKWLPEKGKYLLKNNYWKEYGDRQSVERLENGKINPSIFYLKEIADALEIPVSQLLQFE